MARSATPIPGLEGEWGKYPQTQTFTLPARYADYVDKISKIEGHKNMSDLLRSLLVEKYPVPTSDLDEIEKTEAAMLSVNKKKRRDATLKAAMEAQLEAEDQEQ